MAEQQGDDRTEAAQIVAFFASTSVGRRLSSAPDADVTELVAHGLVRPAGVWLTDIRVVGTLTAVHM
jgi:hypothetical protein